jgi:hypothetical protein
MRVIAIIGCFVLAVLVASCSKGPDSGSGRSASDASAEPGSDSASSRSSGSTAPAKTGKVVPIEELGFGESKSPEFSVTIHQPLGKGTLDETGWCKAVSTEGGFSVALPNLYNDFTASGTPKNRQPFKHFLVGTRDDRNILFLAVAGKRTDGKSEAEYLEDFVDPIDKTQLVKETPIKLGDMTGVEVRIATKDKLTVHRLYRDKDRFYRLTVEATTPLRFREIEKELDRFMNSLVIPGNGAD